jgi:hypothetical protein
LEYDTGASRTVLCLILPVAILNGRRDVLARKAFAFAISVRLALKKARWAKIKGEIEPPPVTPEPSKAKRQISEEGMERIMAATKKRWRLQRAGQAKAA